ncbi:unnamed protein product [Sphagnum compactum]
MAGFFNWASWVAVGDIANVGQLTGVNAIQLIAMVIKAANNARMHKKNCRQFAQHLKLIGGLLEQLNLTDLKRRPECREPLELLEQALRKAVILVESCRDKSYLYLVAVGWVYVTKFRDYQDEIDRYLKLIPLISLVETSRDRLRAIERDRRLYTLEEDEMKVQETLLKPERSRSDSMRVSHQLSRRYPGYSIDQALREENSKLRKELNHMRACMELEQCDVIEHLIDFTETAAVDPAILKAAGASSPKSTEAAAADRRGERRHKVVKETKLRNMSHPNNSFVTSHYNNEIEDWDRNLFACCFQPCLCIKVFCSPCDTFTLIATSVSDGEISQAQACNNLAFHALYGGCYCYTCCIRRKVRKRFNIEGDACGDYCAHVYCCCCSIMQEWHELQVQEKRAREMDPPLEQAMDK